MLSHQRTRRIGDRASVTWTVWIRAGGRRLRFHTVDVSKKGAKLRPKGSFEPGTAVDLVFITRRRRVRVSAVVWRLDADGMAVLFLGPVPEALTTCAG
jgi:hypothetical protein